MIRVLIRTFIIGILVFFMPGVVMAKDENKSFTVVIDPGHGGKDVGATDNGVMEKNINLKVAKQLESLLKKKLKDVKVVMTRDDDRYLTLQERADKANSSKGDLFISIHTNSVDKKNRNRKSVAGSSVYTLGLHKDDNNLQVAMRENSVIELENDYEQKYSGFDPQRDESYIIFEMAQKKNLSQSIKFAESVEKELVSSGRKDRGVHQAGFWVLWATSMPSVLIELDFICNPESAKYMSSDKGAKELANAIFNAVETYHKNWKKLATADGLNSDNTYTEGEDRLTDSYITETLEPGQYVAVSSRRKKSSPSVSGVTQKRVDPDKRRRRSASSKQRSDNANFERENLEITEKRLMGVVPATDAEASTEAAPALAAVDTSKDSNKKGKSKKEKAKKEKVKKETEKKANNKSNKKTKEDGHNAKVNKLVTVYKIQVLASADLLNQQNPRFCGLSPISTYKENNLYKYYYGESTDKSELEAVLQDVRKKIPDAFIVSSTKSVQTTKK